VEFCDASGKVFPKDASQSYQPHGREALPRLQDSVEVAGVGVNVLKGKKELVVNGFCDGLVT
jgi:hypothetical protein